MRGQISFGTALNTEFFSALQPHCCSFLFHWIILPSQRPAITHGGYHKTGSFVKMHSTIPLYCVAVYYVRLPVPLWEVRPQSLLPADDNWHRSAVHSSIT